MSAVVVRTIDREELRAVVAEVIDVETAEVLDDAGFVDDLGVDSLMALEIVVVLEKKYGVKLGEAELKKISTLRAAHDVMLAKLREG
jgi:acyl carrier protein